jgi:hypothetical protein
MGHSLVAERSQHHCFTSQEEEIRRAAEEKQRQEDEEAAKWMGMISVEKEGTGGVRYRC